MKRSTEGFTTLEQWQQEEKDREIADLKRQLVEKDEALRDAAAFMRGDISGPSQKLGILKEISKALEGSAE